MASSLAYEKAAAGLWFDGTRFQKATFYSVGGERGLDAKIKAFLDAGVFYVKNRTSSPIS